MVEEQLGLRELKKQLTREQIAAAALKLTQHRGIASVTIDEIAREAFVSPRTVSNYFPTKEEAVLAAGQSSYDAMFQEYSAATSEEPPLEVLRGIFTQHAHEHPGHLRMLVQLENLEHDNPTLKPHRLAQVAARITSLSERIAKRTGTDPATDPYPSMTASAAIIAMSHSMTIWSHCSCPEGRLPELIEEAFNVAIQGYVPASE